MKTTITKIEDKSYYAKLDNLGECKILYCPNTLAVGDKIEIKLQAQTNPGVHRVDWKFIKTID